MQMIWPRKAQATERQLEVIRRLLRYADSFAEHMRIHNFQHELEYIFDAISDGERLLKQLGGSAIR